MEAKHPTLRQTMLAAMGNVNPSHLYDRRLQAAPTPSESSEPPLEGSGRGLGEAPLIAAAALRR
jgi:hypothetical protein